MPKDTRAQFLFAAVKLFADKGFYGTSIADIADAVGLTKQALLHHFGNKEGLYAEVLSEISDAFTRELEIIAADSGQPEKQLDLFARRFFTRSLKQPDETRLLMRELLDNKRRAGHAKTWYLKGFLETVSDLLLACPGWRGRSRPEALAAIYQMIGSTVYFAVSQPTLESMFGADTVEAMARHYHAGAGQLHHDS